MDLDEENEEINNSLDLEEESNKEKEDLMNIFGKLDSNINQR